MTKEIIFAYLNGNATAWQKKQIEQWIKQEDHEELFYQYLDEWEKTHLQYSSNVSAAITKYYERIDEKTEDTCRISPPISPYKAKREVRFIRVASICILALFIQLITGDTWGYLRIQASLDQSKEYELEDHSKVELNPGASITFKKRWCTTQDRIVWLEGGAKFVVKHIANDRKFIVKTQNSTNISVLGTTFSVRTSPRSTAVHLEEGAVELDQTIGTIKHHLAMMPGECVVADVHGLQKEKPVNFKEHSIQANTEQRFVFEQTSLSEIVSMLENTYQVKSSIGNPTIASNTLSGSFRASHYLELVSSLAEILQIQYRIEKDESITFY